MAGTFKIGDVVNLRSDKINKMVVNEINDTTYKCIWFDVTIELCEHDFKVEVLELSNVPE